MQARWFAVVCDEAQGFKRGRRVFGEFAACERIGREGWAAFTPVRRVLLSARGGNRRREDILAPLFPGYAFALFDERVWQRERIRAWPEVIDVVRCGRDPHPIPDTVITRIRELEKAYQSGDVTGDPVQALAELLKVGERVQLRDVAWQGQVGTLERIDGPRSVVLMSLFGVPTPVTVATHDVVPL
jgi:transcription antitermination factor NusG